MASTAAPSFHSTKETTNYARLCRLLVDIGSHVLRETFDKKRPPGNLDTVLSRTSIHSALQSLRKKKIINPSQWGKLYPTMKSTVSSRDFDITLLTILLRNICGLVPPPTGWDALPPVADTTLEADIARIKCYRNTVYGHASEASVDDATFNKYWQDIQDALVRLGGAGYQSAIDDLKNECIDPDFEEHHREVLKQWVMGEVSIKERLDEIEEKVMRKLDDWREAMVLDLEKKIEPEAVEACTNLLKASIKSQTEFHPLTTHTKSRVKTDEIFTSLLIQHGRKPVKDLDMEREEHLRQYGKVSGKPVKHHQEIFFSDTDDTEESNPKIILVTGKAGIGKTLFCQKLIRDWADDKLFQSGIRSYIPDFKFAYLLTFRQLNLLGEARVTLREILNRSSVLEDHSNIDDRLFDYFVDHPEDVLIVIDGFDEYLKQDFIASDLDEMCPNNAKEEMPVAALCAKLIKRKILNGSVVMITSRPDESDMIWKDGLINLDRFVEITGFSEEQVKEYIEKYFKENEEMKTAVMDHVTKNDSLVSFAHIPVLCFLMCSYFEYVLEDSTNTDALPVNSSDIYFEVINMFLKKHHKKTETPPKDTLKKLSELAAQFLREKKFLFVIEDLKGFTSKEIENLRASGLLHCGPPFKKSFSEMTKYFCFTHLTLQEYLAASWFVEIKEIPPGSKGVSEMVFQFMSGILSKKKDKAFMEKILDTLNLVSEHFSRTKLLRIKCLAEYQDLEFAKHFVKKHYNQFCDCDRGITLEHLTDVDCIALSFLLEVTSTFDVRETSEMSFSDRLSIRKCSVTETGFRRILKALKKEHSTITNLEITLGRWLSDGFGDTIRKLLPLTRVTTLALCGDQISDAIVVSLCQALETPTCQVTALNLKDDQITNAGVVRLCQALKTASCKVTTLNLDKNQVTDAGVFSLGKVLRTPTCRVTGLSLRENQITDVGVLRLCKALKTETCEVTSLDLSLNQITDAGVLSLCEALQKASCRVAALILRDNQITDAGVASLCQAFQTATCRVTKLDLSQNLITDAGVNSVSQAMQKATCKITGLNLSDNTISDAGVVRLCYALQTATCEVNALDLSQNLITDAGVVELCQALQTPTCKVTTLNLSHNQITDVSVDSLCQALESGTCNVTHLKLASNRITHDGCQRLRDLLKQKPNLNLLL